MGEFAPDQERLRAACRNLLGQPKRLGPGYRDGRGAALDVRQIEGSAKHQLVHVERGILILLLMRIGARRPGPFAGAWRQTDHLSSLTRPVQ